MEQIFEFITNNLILVSVFAVLLIAFIVTESRKGGGNISPQKAALLINRDDAVVLDVRTNQEFTNGHIVNAINIPYTAIDKQLSELEKHKSKPIIIACKVGQHAGVVGRTLNKTGFTNINRIAGGMAGWANANLPVVK